jgi:multiple sugar transport system permease protein
MPATETVGAIQAVGASEAGSGRDARRPAQAARTAGVAQWKAPVRRSWRPPWQHRLHASETTLAIAFLAPYVAVFIVFVAYPIGFGVWMGSDTASYAALLDNPRYPVVVINTLLLAGVGVNLKMFLAFLMSGFFMRPGRWIKALLLVYMLPWALPALPAYLSLHWMFIGYGGFLNSALEKLGIDGPIWFNAYPLAMSVTILAMIWKWLPFWTLVFIAGRMAIPRDIYEAAAVDGAAGLRRFTYVTFPLLANLYLICTLLSTLWTVGDFTTAYFVSSGAPALSTEVLATFAFRVAFDHGYPRLGMAAVMTALPLTIPLTILLMRRVQATEVQL